MFFLSATLQQFDWNQGSWDFKTIQTMELSRSIQYNQNFTTNRSCLQEWEDGTASACSILALYHATIQKEGAPNLMGFVWSGPWRWNSDLNRVNISSKIPWDRPPNHYLCKAYSLYQMVASWLSFTTDLGQTWTRDQEMKGSISHYQL